jgi:hypothetical protein
VKYPPEKELVQRLGRWLMAIGYQVSYEEPAAGCKNFPGVRRIDLVARSGERIIAVEAKKSMDFTLLHQCLSLRGRYTEVWAAVWSRPKPASLAEYAGSGVRVLCLRGSQLEILYGPL